MRKVAIFADHVATVAGKSLMVDAMGRYFIDGHDNEIPNENVQQLVAKGALKWIDESNPLVAANGDSPKNTNAEESSDLRKKPSGYWSRKIAMALISLGGEGHSRSEIVEYILTNLNDELLNEQDVEKIWERVWPYLNGDPWFVRTGGKSGREFLFQIKYINEIAKYPKASNRNNRTTNITMGIFYALTLLDFSSEGFTVDDVRNFYETYPNFMTDFHAVASIESWQVRDAIKQSAGLIFENGKIKNAPFYKLGSENLDKLCERIAGRAPEDNNETETVSKGQYLEKDLHPLINYWLANPNNPLSQNRIFLKTIDQSRCNSGAKGEREWLHPDLVGVEVIKPFSTNSTLSDIRRSIGESEAAPIRFYAFELKRSLSLANLNECFFQALSGTAWAHEGYLVAAEISDNCDTKLRRLCQRFGIGVIKLDTKKLTGHVIIPAQSQPTLDWDTMKELMGNTDFKDVADKVKEILRLPNPESKETLLEGVSDKILTEEELNEIFGIK